MASTFSSRVLSHPLVGAPESAAGADPKRTRVLKALTVVNTLAPLDMLVESEMEARKAAIKQPPLGLRSLKPDGSAAPRGDKLFARCAEIARQQRALQEQRPTALLNSRGPPEYAQLSIAQPQDALVSLGRGGFPIAKDIDATRKALEARAETLAALGRHELPAARAADSRSSDAPSALSTKLSRAWRLPYTLSERELKQAATLALAEEARETARQKDDKENSGARRPKLKPARAQQHDDKENSGARRPKLKPARAQQHDDKENSGAPRPKPKPARGDQENCPTTPRQAPTKTLESRTPEPSTRAGRTPCDKRAAGLDDVADSIVDDSGYTETPMKSSRPSKARVTLGSLPTASRTPGQLLARRSEKGFRCDSRRALHAALNTAAGELGTTLRERRLGWAALEAPLRIVVTPVTEIELEQRRLFIQANRLRRASFYATADGLADFPEDAEPCASPASDADACASPAEAQASRPPQKPATPAEPILLPETLDVEAPPREEQKDLFEAMGSLDFSACVQEEFAKWADNLDIQSPARQLPGASGLDALKSVPRRRLKAGSRAAQSALSMRLSVPRQKERMLV